MMSLRAVSGRKKNETTLRIAAFSVAIALLLAVGGFFACIFLIADHCGSALSYYGCDAANTASANSSDSDIKATSPRRSP